MDEEIGQRAPRARKKVMASVKAHPLRVVAMASALVAAMAPVIETNFPGSGIWLRLIQDSLSVIAGGVVGNYMMKGTK